MLARASYRVAVDPRGYSVWSARAQVASAACSVAPRHHRHRPLRLRSDTDTMAASSAHPASRRSRRRSARPRGASAPPVTSRASSSRSAARRRSSRRARCLVTEGQRSGRRGILQQRGTFRPRADPAAAQRTAVGPGPVRRSWRGRGDCARDSAASHPDGACRTGSADLAARPSAGGTGARRRTPQATPGTGGYASACQVCLHLPYGRPVRPDCATALGRRPPVAAGRSR